MECTLVPSASLYVYQLQSRVGELTNYQIENSVVFCQHNVTGIVRLSAYKGNTYVLGRSSNASNLYSEQDASMDSLEGFSPMDTTGFIAIQAIRLKKYGEQKIKDGQPLTKP